MLESGEANCVQVPEWKRYAWLRHGFSTRGHGFSTVYAQGGSAELNLGLTTHDDPMSVEANRRQVTESLGGCGAALATVRQLHGTVIVEASEGGRSGDADGVVTRQPGLLLGVLAADCVPILMADVRRRIVGAFHAGWRGTAAGMASEGVARMLALGAHAEDLVAAIGPSIGPCCYEVGDEVIEALAARNGATQGRYADLWESNRRQLAEAGVGPERIRVVGECTACSRWTDGRRKYFSHRAEGGVTGRAMGLIGIF